MLVVFGINTTRGYILRCNMWLDKTEAISIRAQFQLEFDLITFIVVSAKQLINQAAQWKNFETKPMLNEENARNVSSFD